MKSILLVMTNPVAGMDDEFNRWYDEVHVPEFLKIPGFAAAQRFVAEPLPNGEVPSERYLTIYELDVEVSEALAAAAESRSSRSPTSPALDGSSSQRVAYRPLGPRLEADAARQ